MNAETGNRADYGAAAMVLRQIADEGAVDFDLVERIGPQIAQARESRSEIVHRYAHAEFAQPGERGDAFRRLFQENGFGDFNFQPVGRKARADEGVMRRLDHVAALKLD